MTGVGLLLIALGFINFGVWAVKRIARKNATNQTAPTRDILDGTLEFYGMLTLPPAGLLLIILDVIT